MEYLTNCKNCNAPLYYDDEDYAKCQYCGTEYHYDKIYKKKKMIENTNYVARQIDDRTIELELYGKKKKFYISEVEMHPICTCSYISPDDRFKTEDWEYKCALRLIEV